MLQIRKVKYRKGDYESGCPTCDYGSEYLSDFTVVTNEGTVRFQYNTEYDYVSESDLMIAVSKQYAHLTDFIKIICEGEDTMGYCPMRVIITENPEQLPNTNGFLEFDDNLEKDYWWKAN